MRWLMTALFAVCCAAPTATAVANDAVFVADRACPAFQSKRRGTNPGNVETAPGTTYRVVEENPHDPDYVRVYVPEAPGVAERWVPTACGALQPAGVTAADRKAQNTVLAVSWQPATCERLTRAAECRLINSGRLAAATNRFSIHGLWPRDEEFCGRVRSARRFSELPEPDMSRHTRARLDALMPATMSDLHRHQWAKHGTCYRAPGGAEEYFADTVQLVEALNASPIPAWLAEHTRRRVSREEVRSAFDAAFGRGAGRRVSLHCADDRDSGRTLLVELRINLAGRISPDTSLATLMRDAPPAGRGCPGGIVDPAGDQG